MPIDDYLLDADEGEITILRPWLLPAWSEEASMIHAVYRAGYAVLDSDIALGLDEVPDDLKLGVRHDGQRDARPGRGRRPGDLAERRRAELPAPHRRQRDPERGHGHPGQLLRVEPGRLLMAWPSIPVDLILTDRVRIRHWLAWTADSVGGRVPSYSSYGASTPCAIEAKTAADLMTQNRSIRWYSTMSRSPSTRG